MARVVEVMIVSQVALPNLSSEVEEMSCLNIYNLPRDDEDNMPTYTASGSMCREAGSGRRVRG